MKVYLNGVQVGTGSSTNPGGFYNEINVGHYPNSSLYFTGLIDEVHIYNRALAQAEIQSIVSADTAGLCLPVNDKFANATVLSGTAGSVSGTNVNADNELDEPGHTGPAARATIWYRWTALSNGSVTFNTTPSNFDTELAGYVGTNVDSLSKVASNDDAGGATSSITFNTTTNTTYRIAVAGKNGLTGNITLNWSSAGSTLSTASITGRTTNINGINSGAAGSVQLLKPDGTTINPTVNADGSYTFAGLATITPSAPQQYILLPPNSEYNFSNSQTITLGGDVIAGDFVHKTPSYSVEGTLRDPNGDVLVGATVILSGGNLQPISLVTNSSGKYTSPQLSITGNYTFTPRAFTTATGITYATFNPVKRDYLSIVACSGADCSGNNYINQNFAALNNPVPTMGSISPTSVGQGGNSTSLTVNGTGFVPGSVIRYGGADRITTFVSATQLTTQLTAADTQSAGTQMITVFTPPPGGGLSPSGVNFTVTASAALRLDTVSPAAGRTSGGQQLTLTGSFTGLASVLIGGVTAPVTNSSANQLTVTTPQHAVGAVQIDLVPTSGSTVSKPNAFAYLLTVFTNDTLMIGVTTAKAQHITELRQAVDAMRAVAGLAPAAWTDATLTPASTLIKAVHIQELRTFLDDAAARLGYATTPYTDPTLLGTPIKRIHIEELRQRIRTIAG